MARRRQLCRSARTSGRSPALASHYYPQQSTRTCRFMLIYVQQLEYLTRVFRRRFITVVLCLVRLDFGPAELPIPPKRSITAVDTLDTNRCPFADYGTVASIDSVYGFVCLMWKLIPIRFPVQLSFVLPSRLVLFIYFSFPPFLISYLFHALFSSCNSV